jgi:succinate dehydrogenase/fumarate reductase flavoprotein subunit
MIFFLDMIIGKEVTWFYVNDYRKGFLIMSSWDRAADVVIVGFGGAGCGAAIEAHDIGAETLVLEKQSREYHPVRTDTAMSGGKFMVVTDAESACTYFERCGQGLADKQMYRVWAEEAVKITGWLKGVAPRLRFGTERSPSEHQNFPGAESVFAYQFEGQGLEFFKALTEAVESRGIEVIYDTSGTELVLGSDREVQGIVAECDSRRIRIKARRAIVLTCGSFSANEEMKRNFLPIYPFSTYGSPYNTGDGIKMAMQAGADLWGMNIAGARGVAKFTDLPFAFCVTLRPAPYVIVDKYGKRFMNEDHQAMNRHDVAYTLMNYDAKQGEYPRIPCYWIFDETRRRAGSLDSDVGIRSAHLYEWSEDNLREIERGWIVKAGTLRELGEKLGSEYLEESCETYNRYCRLGKDPDFERSAQTLIPLNNPPYYAVGLYPGGANLLGGPKRNEKSQVIDIYGRIIPRLYAAGELGMPPMRLVVSPGSALSSMLCFGRIAGINAAAEKPWS